MRHRPLPAQGKDSPIQSIADLDPQPGRKVAVKRGTTGNLYAEDRIKKAAVLVLDKEDACVLEVIEGKARRVYLRPNFHLRVIGGATGGRLRAILRPFQQESWAVGLRQDDASLLAQVNQFLKEYKAAGGFVQLGDRWLKDQKEAFRKLGYPFYF